MCVDRLNSAEQRGRACQQHSRSFRCPPFGPVLLPQLLLEPIVLSIPVTRLLRKNDREGIYSRGRNVRHAEQTRSKAAMSSGGGSIRPIDEESIRRIVAGQAITDLASAVKELVDNALDAGSKSINSKSALPATPSLLLVGRFRFGSSRRLPDLTLFYSPPCTTDFILSSEYRSPFNSRPSVLSSPFVSRWLPVAFVTCSSPFRAGHADRGSVR